MKKLRLPGLPSINVISDEAAEKVQYLICAPISEPLMFPDNFTGVCCHCGVKVQYRWHAPRKPKRICMECVVKIEAIKKPSLRAG